MQQVLGCDVMASLCKSMQSSNTASQLHGHCNSSHADADVFEYLAWGRGLNQSSVFDLSWNL
jgi:hypothetical protein